MARKLLDMRSQAVIISLLLVSTLTMALEIHEVKAVELEYIYIKSNGEIYPEDANIQRDGDLYILTNDTKRGRAIVIQRDNMTLDGKNYRVTGLLWDRIGTGIYLSGRKNITIKNVRIRRFQVGINLTGSSNCQLYHNRIYDGNSSDPWSVGIRLLNSSYNTLFDNWVYEPLGGDDTYHRGIALEDSSHNTIFNSTANGNGDEENGYAILLKNSNYNDVFDNTVKNNHDGIGLTHGSHNNSVLFNHVENNGKTYGGVGIELDLNCSYNMLKHNNVIDNHIQVRAMHGSYNNSWDGGYPSGGNYWDDYTGADDYSGPYQNESGSDGIGDTPYPVTDGETVVGQDHYPFNNTIEYTYVYLTVEAGPGGTTDPVPETYPYPVPENYPYMERMEVTVTATPSDGYNFTGWNLDGELRTENPITVTMDSNHTLEARFLNHPPYKPTLSGPPSGDVYTDIYFTANTTDDDNDEVQYEFSWGDDTNNTVIGPYPSGQNATAYHSWSRPITYNVSVQAQDFYGAQSGWSNNKSISINQNDANSGKDAGDGFNQSLLISSVTASYKGTLYNSTDPQDLYDYYRIYLETDQKINVTMTPPAGVDFDLELYDPNGDLKDSSNLPAGETESVSCTADSTVPWRILVNTTDGEGQYSFSVWLGVGGGCPYVSAWNGTQHVLDNNILPTSELSNGTDVEDYYKLEQTLTPTYQGPRFSLYSLEICEFEQEHSHIDQVKLIAVDHESGVNIAVTPDGEILTYKNPAAPLSAVDNNGTDRLDEILHMDGDVSDPATYFYGKADDYLVLNFGNIDSQDAKLILRDDMKSEVICINVQVLDVNGVWQTVAVLSPRSYWSIEAVDLSAYVVQDQDFMVRLFWTSPHRLDYIGLDTTQQADYELHTAYLVSAVHSTQGNVKALLRKSDSLYAQLLPGQQIQLEFALPNNTKQARTYILYTKGRYHTIP